ncbi:MAG: helix-turn-helix domain-containing protein [Oscillospiraceae bacterium]|nr:helix-turn-helix domain-containing protein [Oscillospiraceae bacterium]
MYEVLKYIHAHIGDPLNLTQLADRFGYSKWHFCAKFHEYTGRSFVKYVRHYRLQLAALDILSGKTVTETASAYGYDTIGGFNKAFLAQYGCLPREYKRHAKETQLYYERRAHSMYPLTDRCELLKQLVTGTNDYEDRYCIQRQVYSALGRIEAAEKGCSPTEITAAGLCNVLENFSPVILPGELIVGFNHPDTKYPERFTPTDTPEHRELAKRNRIPEEMLDRYFAFQKDPALELHFEYRKHIPDYAHAVSAAPTQQELDSTEDQSSIARNIDSNHTVIGYEKVLKLGFRGLLEEVRAYEEKNGPCAMYDGMKKLCDAACQMGKKYAAEAQALLDLEDDAYQTEDLEKIIEVCSRVPEQPAKTFHEAVQTLWFAHILNTWEDFINANSLGRLDQILYPYYQRDVAAGRLTKEEAFELICCLWLKLYRNYDVQQSCVGGTAPDGSSAVNELSYMMLDATEQLNIIRCLSVRFSQNTEKDFVQRALEVVGHVQKGVPFFFNDDVMIPALTSKGIDMADAYDYTQIGCVETVIPGRSNPHAVTGEINVLKALEYAMNNGGSMMYPHLHPGAETGPLDHFDTYEKFYAAVKKQICHLLDLTCSKVKKYREYSALYNPKPYKSLLTEGCLESGRDFNDAGAKYDYYQIMLDGIPNLADSLEVIREFVYRQKKFTLTELKDILEHDYPNEAVRLSFINKAAKFGNDIDSVDSIAADLIGTACDALDALSGKYELSFHAQPFTYWWMVDRGQQTAATPDGRHRGEIMAYSVSPMQGRDFNGLTALLNSISKLPTTRTPGTTSAIVEVDPKLFTDRNIPMLTDILFAAAKNGLENVQFNTIDADTLIDAKKHPEKYNNLAVRVSGFSQKFNLLSEDLQDHIIGRTKHACL